MTCPKGGEDFVMLHFAGEVDVSIHSLEDRSSRSRTHSNRADACEISDGGSAYLD